jgi:hypothetical protein
MVIFSSVTISKRLADCAIETAGREKSRLLMVDVKSRRVPRRVASMTGERGFMGKEVVDRLEKDISRERQDHIDRRLKELEIRAKKKGIETETFVLESPSIRKILDIAKKRDVSVIIAEKQMEDVIDQEDIPFEVIHVKE